MTKRYGLANDLYHERSGNPEDLALTIVQQIYGLEQDQGRYIYVQHQESLS